MPKGPAVIIVVRHGARLDAANRDWHLTSPEPYNPPLTYGGWNQSRALGTRIASLLRLREDGLLDNDELKEKLSEYAMNGNSDASVSVSTKGETATQRSKKRKRKHRIVLHTSPYLRCVQTSIAISAGIASTKKASRKSSSRADDTAAQLADLSLSANPMNVVAVSDFAPHLYDGKPEQKRLSVPDRPLLRVDALLGEWQNPEYYEGMTPPPNSATMVLSAKAELLRRGEPVEVSAGVSINRGNFPGGWGSSSLMRPSTLSAARAPPYQSLLTAGSLPMDISSRDGTRSRSGSISSVSSVESRSGHRTRRKCGRTAAYVAPTPRYAVGSSDTIPQGFVAHARDACVDVDFQWDSMRPPQDWGDGGELGEEWGAMHKRIRNGFQKMIRWYKVRGMESSQDEHPLAFPEDDDQSFLNENVANDDEDGDDDEDLVLVLVSHGAACNALIGALTNQPVLLDVGMASLTMAIRREICCNGGRPSLPDRSHTVHGEMELSKRRRSSVDFGHSRDYEMKLIASTEHLRPPKTITNGAETTSEGRGYERKNSTNASLGSVRRNNTTSGHSRPVSRRQLSPSPERSRTIDTKGGLWSAPPTKQAMLPPTIPDTTTSDSLINGNGWRSPWSARPHTASRAGTTSTWSNAPTTQATTPATLPDTTLSEPSDSPTSLSFSLGAALGVSNGADDASGVVEKPVERVRFELDQLEQLHLAEDDDIPGSLPGDGDAAGGRGLWGARGRGMPQRRWTVDQRG